MKVLFLGDVMPSGDQTGKEVQVSNRLTKYLSGFDCRIATLESAVGTYDTIHETKQPRSEVAVWSKEEDLHKLLDFGINVVSLANNHACDCGIDSMIRLKETLHGMGIASIGAGRNLTEASAPYIIEKSGISFAVVGVCDDNPASLGTLQFATEESAGIYRFNEENLIKQIKELKQQYSHVAIVVHWGVEHKWLPEQCDIDRGKSLIDAGADIIMGGHPHHIQPMIIYKKRPVFFSLGNYYFPDFCLDKVSNMYYPDQLEMDNLPVFDWMSPDRRSFAMKYFWKYYGRLGMAACVDIGSANIVSNVRFTIYKKGRIKLSKMSLAHLCGLKLHSFFVGKQISPKINYYETLIRNIIEYKFLSLFVKKYQFFKYLEKNKME